MFGADNPRRTQSNAGQNVASLRLAQCIELTGIGDQLQSRHLVASAHKNSQNRRKQRNWQRPAQNYTTATTAFVREVLRQAPFSGYLERGSKSGTRFEERTARHSYLAHSSLPLVNFRSNQHS